MFSMSRELKVFSFNDSNTRVIVVDGEPWIVATDVAGALEYSEASRPSRLFQAVPDEWKGVKRIHTPGGEQSMLCLSEQGLYFFLGRSDKPKALPYQKWIAGEVVPSIRKHGAYLTPAKLEEVLLNPDTIIKLAQALKDEQEKRAALEAQAEVDRPKVLFADAVSESKTSILIGNMAKLLKQNNVNIGQNHLFRWLRENGYLIKRQGSSYNMPTQAAMEKELFEVVERVYNLPDGSTRITRTVKVTGKGQVHLINKFIGSKKEGEAAA